MNKLPANFEIDRYGLHGRLVREEDAEFILSLRTNPALSKYLHAVDNDLVKQKQWIRAYKEREDRGEDYYFIFYYESKPIGLIRIYDIDSTKKTATAGSWCCAPDLPIQIPVMVLVICREIMFETLGVEKDLFDVRIGNKKVLRVHEMMGAEITSRDELNYYLSLSKGAFEEKKQEIVEMLNC